jgi:hypothetical protein
MKTHKELLDAVAAFLNGETVEREEKQEVWNVLSALRGPDMDGSVATELEVKGATTSVIREKLFGRGNRACLDVGISSGADSELNVGIRKNMAEYSHFTIHAKSAFRALGLKWDEVNNAEDKEE